MKIGVIGCGYVGLITGVCLAEMGHSLICVDNNEEKIKKLKNLIPPIYESGLSELLKKNKNRLKFTTSIEKAVKDSTVIFIAVGTPPKESGDADLSAVENVLTSIVECMDSYRLIVEKSTVPVQTGMKIKNVMEMRASGVPFDIASNPEFLREGSAIDDFLHPDRIVIGLETERAKEILLKIYEPLGVPIIVTDLQSAEIIKHASNSFLATKISYINAISVICELAGANIKDVARGMGLDPRIGDKFLNAGVGFGGFCFPKDVRAFMRISEKLGYRFNLLKEVEKINELAKERFVEKIKDVLWNLQGKVIGILGLAFKPNTDDMRYAPSIDIINHLLSEGAKVVAYDPVAMENARRVLPDIEYRENPYDVADGADCLAIVTEWDEFKNLDIEKIKSLLKTPIIFDGRNIFKKEKMEELGFIYRGIGI
ncbi:MAG: UDP-glucose/GDP-mannose dehydrogenase family protein [candidate division WOR-3 bacterium]|nr:UDP-glucose/GDP-mannose dehydrogenase family protein [candidate division WOR-3 bacterium]